MIYESGTVTSVENDGVWVETLRQSTCGSCHAKTGCGQRLLNQLGMGNAQVRAQLQMSSRSQNLAAGDRVEIGINEGAIVLGSLLSYGLPIVMLVLGALAGERLGSEFTALLSAAIGLLTGVLIANTLLLARFENHFFVPVVTRQLPADPATSVIASDAGAKRSIS